MFEQMQKDFLPFTDRFGFITPDGGTSGNGTLYTAEYIIALIDNCKEIPPEEHDRLVKLYQSCEKQPGLMSRNPESPDQEAIDDYIGCGTASYYLQDGLAQRILDYGRKNKVFGIIPYHYNNVNPGVWNPKAFIGRQQQIIAHLRFAAGEIPNLFQKIWWCVALILSAHAPKENQDAYSLAWQLIRVGENKSLLCDLVIKYWRKKQASKGINIASILGSYFNNFDHPLVKWLKDSK